MGVRLEFTGDAEAVEIDYRTATAELGLRGAGAGTEFALYRGAQLRERGARACSARARVRLAAGAGPARGIVYLPEGMRPVVTAIRAIGGAIAPAPPQRRWLCYGDSIAEGWLAAGPAGAWPARVGARVRARRRQPGLCGWRARRDRVGRGDRPRCAPT